MENNETENYPALRSLISVISGASYVFLICSIFLFIGILISSRMDSGIFVDSGYTNIELFLGSLSLFFVYILLRSLAELLKLIMDIEKNTRK